MLVTAMNWVASQCMTKFAIAVTSHGIFSSDENEMKSDEIRGYERYEPTCKRPNTLIFAALKNVFKNVEK